MKLRHLLLGATAFFLGLALFCLGVYWTGTVPEAAAPELAERARPERPPQQTARPRPERVPAPDDADRCGASVLAIDPDGAPVVGARFTASASAPDDAPAEDDWRDSRHCSTGDDGRCALPELACGEKGRFRVKAEGFAPWRQNRPSVDDAIELVAELQPGVLLDGRVTDARTGEPIADAWVLVERHGEKTDADGDYAFWVAPVGADWIEAGQAGYIEERRLITLTDESAGVTIDFALDRLRQVEVWCAGLPDDSCESVMPGVLCTRREFAFGEGCDETAGAVLCTCPEGDAAIRAGGEAVAIGPDDEVAWLDFRYDGAITGLVTRGGEPLEGCRVELIRAPEIPTEELSRGIVAGRRSGCEPDGTFLVEGLKPGTWRLSVSDDGEERTLPHVWVDGELVDVGELELGGGATIYGQVTDALTGEPVDDALVLCAPFGEGPAAMPAGGDSANSDGRFEVTGLEPGDYTVYAINEPYDRVRVSLADGEEVEVNLQVGRDELDAVRGWSLATDGAGDLVVDSVVEGGAAEAAGLMPGDVITGASAMGLDLSKLHAEMHQAVLRYYGGGGVTLTVERDGEVIQIPL